MNEKDKNKKIDKLTKKAMQLDDICSSIYLTLIAMNSLRFNELYRAVIKLNPKQSSGKPFVSRPSFNEHLAHLKKQKLIVMKKQGKQNVTYSLNKDAMSIFSKDSEDSRGIFDWIESMSELEMINPKEYYANLPEKVLDQKLHRDLNEVLRVNLLELKSFVNYDLKIDEKESDAEFWKFVGNPLYRMLERQIAENCRESIEYRQKFFDKVASLLKERPLLKILNDSSEA